MKHHAQQLFPGDRVRPTNDSVLLHDSLVKDPYTTSYPDSPFSKKTVWLPPTAKALVIAVRNHMFNHPANGAVFVLATSHMYPNGTTGWVEMLNLTKEEE